MGSLCLRNIHSDYFIYKIEIISQNKSTVNKLNYIQSYNEIIIIL